MSQMICHLAPGCRSHGHRQNSELGKSIAIFVAGARSLAILNSGP
jgi:hypothetical protein